jgi:hypothetical protein
MSFWSTLKSMCRTQERQQTRYTILIVWPDGFRLEGSPISIMPYVEGMLQIRHLPQRVEIWRHSGPLRGIGPESAADRLLLLLCPQNLVPVTGGSLVRKSQDFSGLLGGLNTLGASSLSGSTPALGQAPSSK